MSKKVAFDKDKIPAMIAASTRKEENNMTALSYKSPDDGLLLGDVYDKIFNYERYANTKELKDIFAKEVAKKLTDDDNLELTVYVPESKKFVFESAICVICFGFSRYSIGDTIRVHQCQRTNDKYLEIYKKILNEFAKFKHFDHIYNGYPEDIDTISLQIHRFIQLTEKKIDYIEEINKKFMLYRHIVEYMEYFFNDIREIKDEPTLRVQRYLHSHNPDRSYESYRFYVVTDKIRTGEYSVCVQVNYNHCLVTMTNNCHEIPKINPYVKSYCDSIVDDQLEMFLNPKFIHVSKPCRGDPVCSRYIEPSEIRSIQDFYNIFTASRNRNGPVFLCKKESKFARCLGDAEDQQINVTRLIKNVKSGKYSSNMYILQEKVPSRDFNDFYIFTDFRSRVFIVQIYLVKFHIEDYLHILVHEFQRPFYGKDLDVLKLMVSNMISENYYCIHMETKINLIHDLFHNRIDFLDFEIDVFYGERKQNYINRIIECRYHKIIRITNIGETPVRDKMWLCKNLRNYFDVSRDTYASFLRLHSDDYFSSFDTVKESEFTYIEYNQKKSDKGATRVVRDPAIYLMKDEDNDTTVCLCQTLLSFSFGGYMRTSAHMRRISIKIVPRRIHTEQIFESYSDAYDEPVEEPARHVRRWSSDEGSAGGWPSDREYGERSSDDEYG